MLHGLAFAVGEVGDRLGGLALQLAELAAQDDLGKFMLLLAIKAQPVAFEKQRQQADTRPHVGLGDFGVGEQFARLGRLEQGHPCRTPIGLP
jgi:hypothetical protein